MKKCLLIIAFICSAAYGDWNGLFDQNTEFLLSELIGANVEEYEKEYNFYLKKRDKCLRDTELRKQIGNMSVSDKQIILRPKESVVIKKRRENLIYEVFAWEIATLLGANSCIVPSFPLDIKGKQVVMQKMESFDLSEKESTLNKAVVKKVSLESYWIASFQAYLLGLGDLVGRNIGINKEGKIRFFDIESSFKYENQPKRHKNCFYTGFVSSSFTWPQFQKPIDEKTVEAVEHFVRSLDYLEGNIGTYLKYRPFPLGLEGFNYRLQKIREFPLEEGRTFEDFFRYLFPRLSAGFAEICPILEKITQKKVTIGTAAIIGRKGLENEKISSKDKKHINNWLATYVD